MINYRLVYISSGSKRVSSFIEVVVEKVRYYNVLNIIIFYNLRKREKVYIFLDFIKRD